MRYPKINMFILSVYEIDKIDSEISRWPPLKWMKHGWYHIEYQTFLHYNWPIPFAKCTKYYHGITHFEINMQWFFFKEIKLLKMLLMNNYLQKGGPQLKTRWYHELKNASKSFGHVCNPKMNKSLGIKILMLHYFHSKLI